MRHTPVDLIHAGPYLTINHNLLNSECRTKSGHNMRRPSLFKLRDVSRATKAVLATGLAVERVEISKNGEIVVIPCQHVKPADEAANEENEWDTALK